MSDSAARNDYLAGEAPYSLLSRRPGFGTPSLVPLGRAVAALAGRGIGHLRTVRDRRAMVECLNRLDDRIIDDIGVNRNEIEAFVVSVIARRSGANENERNLAA
jgi:uncharacterized protein YjiS (DUF1127 family)